ncbi:hypothetical protein [Microcoleus sp. B4-D4]
MLKEEGRWKMEDGRWKMEDGRWKKSVVSRGGAPVPALLVSLVISQ